VDAWTDARWLAGVEGWLDRQLEELGLQSTGALEQPHVRAWSTVLRMPTTGGDVWFKANIPLLAYEAAVVDLLAARRPDFVPGLLATDVEHGWILMADGGERLREIVERERDLGRWLDVLPRYGRLQIDMAEDLERLLGLGLPDRRLETLASRYEDLIDRVDMVTDEERRRLRALVPAIAELCERLASAGVPETIQHDDLHDGQVFVRDGRYLFFDWGDACVSHPFFSMSVTLEGQLAWGLDDVEGSEDIAPYRDAYLESFRGFAAQAELQAAHEIALRLGWICRALNWDRFASGLPAPYREEYLQGVGLRLRMMLVGFD
jgi:Phosphotransferase enzyme family